MIKKTITYKDLDGNLLTGDFWFNLREDEIAKMELRQAGGSLTDYLKQIVADKNGDAIITTFEKILATSFGLRNADNIAFDKSPAISSHFMCTDAYSVLFMELVTDAKTGAEFIVGLVPPELQGKMDQPVLPPELVPAAPYIEQPKPSTPVEDTQLPVRPPTFDHQQKLVAVKPPVEDTRADLEARLAQLNAQADAAKPIVQ
jgi:hypothetical protein